MEENADTYQSPERWTTDYVVLPEHNLVIERFNDWLDYQTVRSVSTKIWNSPGYHRNMNVLVDLRGCTVAISTKELIRLIAFFFSHPESLRGRSAILADTPKNTAISAFFQSHILLLSKAKVVNWLEHGLDFLDVDHSVYGAIDSERAVCLEHAKEKRGRMKA